MVVGSDDKGAIARYCSNSGDVVYFGCTANVSKSKEATVIFDGFRVC